MQNFGFSVGLVLALVPSGGCQSAQEPGREGEGAAVAASSQVMAEQLAAKERELAAREQALRDSETQRLAQKELELGKREAELNRAAQEASVESKPIGSAPPPSGDAGGSEDVSVTVQLRVNLTKPDGQAWDVGGGAPDPEITLQGSSGAPLVKRFTDTVAPTVSAKVKLKKGDRVTVTATDKDALASDPIGSLTVVYPGKNSTQSGALGAAQATIIFAR